MTKARQRRVLPTSGAFVSGHWVSNFELGFNDGNTNQPPMGGQAMLDAALDTSPNRDTAGLHVLKNTATMPKTYYQGWIKGNEARLNVLRDQQLLALTKAFCASIGRNYDDLTVPERMYVRDAAKEGLSIA